MQVPSEGRHGSVRTKNRLEASGDAGIRHFVGRSEGERFLHVLGKAVGRT